jgi:hypothetical protein
MFKRIVADPAPRLLDYHRQLYASFRAGQPTLSGLRLYETVPLDPSSSDGVSIQTTADSSLWIALLLRQGQDPPNDPAVLAATRKALAGSILSIGFVPRIEDPSRQLAPLQATGVIGAEQLTFQMPLVPPGGLLPSDTAKRVPQYRTLNARALADVLSEPGIVEVTLPDVDGLGTWTDLDPLEAGVGDFPPPLEDPGLTGRLVTWLRIKAVSGAQAGLQWAGINATTISQRVHVANEVPGTGTGEPDQVVALAHSSVIPGSTRLAVGDSFATWNEIDDLFAAGPEVPVPDLRLPPGAQQQSTAPANVYLLDAAAGELRFGDGARGARPPAGEILRADYDYGLGAAGNVGAGSINTAPSLPAGIIVTNPVRTWGGADAETVSEAEKQAARYLQHRDRLVTTEDFESIVWRTPGADLGRIDVLAAFNPQLTPNAPGDAPGAVTLMVVPRHDPDHPDAPQPDRPLIDAVCRYIEPRRLVTTEVFVRGPSYRSIWISVGIDVLPGVAGSEVTQRVRSELARFLAPVDPSLPPWYETAPPGVDQPYVHPERGWPLRKPVVALELVAVASRVQGVDYVRALQLAEGGSAPVAQVDLAALELPRLLGVSVVAGDPLDLDQVRGLTPEPPQPIPTLPVPLVPDSC